MGIMQAIELVKDPKTKEPNPKRTQSIRRNKTPGRADRQGRFVRQRDPNGIDAELLEGHGR
jgi:hypothetical protein